MYFHFVFFLSFFFFSGFYTLDISTALLKASSPPLSFSPLSPFILFQIFYARYFDEFFQKITMESI